MASPSTESRVATAVAVALLTATAGTSFAQEEEILEEVIVTGSRIKSANLDSPSPVQVFSADDIESTGFLNVQDLLLANPTFGTPGISRTNSNFATSGSGVATVDLRNLGSERTLTLVDGRRFVSGQPGFSAIDYNTIPAQFIERIDVLTGGASSVYGSDAVAGVVNIILKKDFEGLAVDAQYGISEEGDDSGTQLGLTFGTNTADGRGNIMAHLGYTKQGAVYGRDRKRSAVDQISEVYFGGDTFTPVRPFYSGFAPQGYFWAGDAAFTYDAEGNVIDQDTNGDEGPATGFNRSQFRLMAVPVERYLFATRGGFEFTEGHRAFFEGTYAASNAISILEAFPLGAEDIYPATGGQVPAEFDVNGTLVRNPAVPDEVFDAATDTDGDGLRDYYFTKRMSEFGNRGSEADRDTFRLVGGLEGAVGSSNWNYEAYYVYGQTKESQRTDGQVNVLNFRNALEAIQDVDDVDGDGDTTDAVCRDTNAILQGCVPANIFGLGMLSPEAIGYIYAPGSYRSFVSQKVLGLNLSGELFDLPAGPLAVAIGGEYRKEHSSTEWDALQQAGLNAGNIIKPTRGGFDVTEGYLEAAAPLLQGAPGAENLTLRAAVRASDYSTVGNALSWNAGFEWSPIQSLRFRAIRALSTRAPNVDELYSVGQDFPLVIDPCEGITATSTGAVDDACRAAPGVMANILANGEFTLNQSDIQGVSGFDLGNPDLSEEKGYSWTIGAVFTPEYIPILNRFNFTLDYYRIKIKDAIVETPRQFILTQCYTGADTGFCGEITRRPTDIGVNSAGSLEWIDAKTVNSGDEFAEGIDLSVGYSQPVGPGNLSARLAYTHVLDKWIVPWPDTPKDSLDGEILDTADGGSKDRANLTLGYTQGAFGATLNLNYIGKAELDDQFNGPGYKVAAKTYVNGQAQFSPSDTWQIYAGVHNLFNTAPPPLITGLPGNLSGAETAADVYDAIGRRWYAGVRVKF